MATKSIWQLRHHFEDESVTLNQEARENTRQEINDLEADIFHLARDEIYQTEKPYGMRYYVESVPQSNIRRSVHRVHLRDMRKTKMTNCFAKTGFGILPLKSRMTYNDFYDTDKIASIYHEDLAAALKQRFEASHVFVMDHAVRRRDLDFPISTGRDYQHDQPTNMVHIDFTREEAERMIKVLYGDRSSEVLQARWQVINVWKPLRGPVRDWPLGIVDGRTVDFREDTMAGDIVFPTWFTENLQVMHNPKHEWYYLPDQMPEEALIFKSADSADVGPNACPHAGFRTPKASQSDLPRESIDCRTFVLYADLDPFPPEVGSLFGGHME